MRLVYFFVIVCSLGSTRVYITLHIYYTDDKNIQLFTIEALSMMTCQRESTNIDRGENTKFALVSLDFLVFLGTIL